MMRARVRLALLLAACGVLTCSHDVGAMAAARAASAVPLIIDTDMAFDVDDVGAVCAANAMADAGEVRLVAVVHDTGLPFGVAAVSALLRWYGRDGADAAAPSGQVPLGAFKGEFAADKAGPYDADLQKNWPGSVKNYSQVPDAVAVYRKALAREYDHSVVISSIGFMTNLADLLASGPDAASPLTGRQLVAAKVRLVAVMGGYYPASTDKAEFNFDCGQGLMGPSDECQGKSAYAVSNMPPSVKMVFSGFDIGVVTKSGAALTDCAPAANPCRQAFIDWLGPNKDRCSWDPLTTLYAVRGADATFLKEVGQGGTNVVSAADGSNKWVDGAASNQTYLQFSSDSSPAQIGKLLDQLYCTAPKYPQPSPPAPEPAYTKHAGYNCYGSRNGQPAHGARDLESPPSASSGIASIDACQQRCDRTDGCTGVTVLLEPSGAYQCYRKGDIDLAQCDQHSSFDTWVKTS